MQPATHKLLRSRLALDYQVASRLRAPALKSVKAFASAEHVLRRREVTPEEGERGLATVYLVEYDFRMLAGPGEYVDGALVRFDLLARGGFPRTEPSVQVVSQPLPWSPHVAQPAGVFCIGEIWSSSKGHMLLGALIIHTMRVLNCDEKDRGGGYVGYTPAAIRYWREVLKCRPVNADLEYPLLPPDAAYGIEDPNSAFVPIGGGFEALGVGGPGNDGGFMCLTPQAAERGFTPIGGSR
jgi:hypothetical protein